MEQNQFNRRNWLNRYRRTKKAKREHQGHTEITTADGSCQPLGWVQREEAGVIRVYSLEGGTSGGGWVALVSLRECDKAAFGTTETSWELGPAATATSSATE